MAFYKKSSFLFTLFILALVLVFFFASLGLDPRDRLVPMLVLVTGILLGILCVLGEIYPELFRKTRGTLSALEIPVKAEAPAGTTVSIFHRNGMTVVTIWLFGFSILILLVGFSIAIPIALLVFLKPLAGQGWVKSIIMTVTIWIFSYGFFDLVMGFHLFRGILFGDILIF